MTTDDVAIDAGAPAAERTGEGSLSAERIARAAEFAIRAVLAIAAFAVPLLALPFTADPLLVKAVFVQTVALLAGALWLLGALLSRRIVYRRSPLNAALAGLAVVLGIAAVTSKAPWLSFWGSDPTGEKAASLLAFTVITFVAAAVLRGADVRRLTALLLASFALLGSTVIAALIAGKIGIALPGWLITNPIGTVNALALVLAAGFILSTALSLTSAGVGGRERVSRALAICSGLVAILLLAVLLFVGFRMAWLGIALILSVLIAFHSARHVPGAVRLFGPRSLAIAFLLVILSILFAFRGVPFAATVFQPPVEISPSLSGTLAIAGKVLRDDPLFGFGPANFRLAFVKFREPVINQTPFWQVRFDHGFSFLATVPAALGILGLVALLALVGIGAALIGRVLLSGRSDNPYLWGFGAFALFLFAEWFLYASNATASFLLFLSLGLFSALLHEPRPAAGPFASWWRVSRRAVEIDVPGLMFFASLASVFAAASAFVVLFALGASYAAAVHFQRALDVLNHYGNTDTAKVFLSRAIGLDPSNAVYHQGRAEVALVTVNRTIAEASANQAANAAETFQTEFSSGVAAANRAIALAPSAERWAALGRLYEVAAPFIAGADVAAANAYQEAARLDPIDPLLPLARGRVFLTAADITSLRAGQAAGAEREELDALYKEHLKNAHAAFEQAVGLKPDLAEARFLLAQTYLREGNTGEAIRRIEETARLAPLDIGVAFQLGFLYYRTGDLSRAEQEFSRAISLNPNYANARYFLGLIYDRRGERAKALAEFERISELNPGNEEVGRILLNLRAGRSALAGSAAPAPELRRDVPVRESGTRR